MTHPKQPVITDADGIRRFQDNKVVKHLLNSSTEDLNKIWMMHGNDMFSIEDMLQFYQLIGYSLSGFAEIFSIWLDENDPDQTEWPC